MLKQDHEHLNYLECSVNFSERDFGWLYDEILDKIVLDKIRLD